MVPEDIAAKAMSSGFLLRKTDILSKYAIFASYKTTIYEKSTRNRRRWP